MGHWWHYTNGTAAVAEGGILESSPPSPSWAEDARRRTAGPAGVYRTKEVRPGLCRLFVPLFVFVVATKSHLG